jgi:TPR repeat protein
MPFSLRFPITLVLSIVGLATPAWADFQAGMDAYNHKEYATALREWRPLAEQRNPHAQFFLGVMFENGFGVPQDYVQAHMWYHLAGANGHKDAVKAVVSRKAVESVEGDGGGVGGMRRSPRWVLQL